MNEKTTQQPTGAASDLRGLLDVLRQSPRQATVNEIEQLVDYADSLFEQVEKLKLERDSLQACVGISAQKINELTKDLLFERNKNQDESFRTHWLMTYAGQAMQGILASISEDMTIDYDFVAKESFIAAKAMIDVACPKAAKKSSALGVAALTQGQKQHLTQH